MRRARRARRCSGSTRRADEPALCRDLPGADERARLASASFARSPWAPDYPWGPTEEQDRAEREAFQGPSSGLAKRLSRRYAGSRQFSDEEAQLFATTSGAPRARARSRRWHAMIRDVDVRQVLPAIRVPTLLLHGTDETRVPDRGARYMAERIPGARLVELPGEVPPTGRRRARSGARRDRAVPERRVAGRRLGGAGAGPGARHRPLHRHRRLERARGRARRPGLAGAARHARRRGAPPARPASAAARSTRPATASSPASTGPRGRSAARRRSSRRPRARDRGARRAAHRRVRARERQRRRHRRPHRRPGRRPGAAERGARLEHGQGPRRRLWHRDSTTAARTSSRASPASGGSSRSTRDQPECSKIAAMLRKDAKIELLKKVPLFSQCNKKQLAAIANIADLDRPARRHGADE